MSYLIANFDRQEFIRPEAFGERSDIRSVVDSCEGVLTGLAVLLADGNNRGGGDLRTNDPIVGSWTGGRIAIVDAEVTDTELSVNGQESVPLQQQLIALGRDVSQPLIDAINTVERDSWVVGALNPQSVFSLVDQRELPTEGIARLVTAKGRQLGLHTLSEFFAVLGMNSVVTPYMACKRLQEGVDKMARMLQRNERWTVTKVGFSHGQKPMRFSPFTYETKAADGVIALTFTAFEASAPSNERTFVVNFVKRVDGTPCTTTADVYDLFFPGQVFEKPAPLAARLRSPDVVRLLSGIQNSMGV